MKKYNESNLIYGIKHGFYKYYRDSEEFLSNQSICFY